MKHSHFLSRLLPLALCSCIVAAAASSCSADSAPYAGTWVGCDSIDDVMIRDSLILRPTGKFTEYKHLASHGSNRGFLTLNGSWSLRRGAIEMTFDTTALVWTGDTALGNVIRREYLKGMRQALSDATAQPFGISDVSIKGDSLKGKQSGQPVVMLRSR